MGVGLGLPQFGLLDTYRFKGRQGSAFRKPVSEVEDLEGFKFQGLV